MSSSPFGAFGSTLKLLRRLQVSPWHAAFNIVLMLLVGVLEAATVGMLVPLLSMLTGKRGSDLGRVDQALRLFGIEGRTDQVLALTAAIWGVVVAKNVVNYFATTRTSALRTAAVVELRQRLLQGVLRAPPSFIDTHTSGEISGVFLSEAIRVNRAIDCALNLFQRGGIVIAYVAAVLVLAWRLTVLAVLLGFALAATSMVLGRRAARHGRELTAANVQIGRHAVETVGGLQVVRTTASEESRMREFLIWNEAQATADANSARFVAVIVGTLEVLSVAGAMGLTAFAYRMWLSSGTLDVSRFLAFAFGLMRLLPAVNQLYSTNGLLTTFGGSVEKCAEWLELPTYPQRPFGKLPLTGIRTGVTFSDVAFEYVAGKPALDNVSFELPAGETLAVLGSSGSGKSTLVSLLMRLREPTGGAIRIDGIDHWDFDPASFHAAVAFVEQDPFLFNASVAENVAFGAKSATREDVRRALETVRLGTWVDGLPNGIDAMVGERGATVSGGQRQRLAIARAIVRDPKLLVLDEPTSALDAQTESEVVEAIAAASVGRTTLIITHRPSTVAGADRTLRIRQGRVESVTMREPARVAVS